MFRGLHRRTFRWIRYFFANERLMSLGLVYIWCSRYGTSDVFAIDKVPTTWIEVQNPCALIRFSGTSPPPSLKNRFLVIAASTCVHFLWLEIIQKVFARLCIHLFFNRCSWRQVKATRDSSSDTRSRLSRRENIIIDVITSVGNCGDFAESKESHEYFHDGE